MFLPWEHWRLLSVLEPLLPMKIHWPIVSLVVIDLEVEVDALKLKGLHYQPSEKPAR